MIFKKWPKLFEEVPFRKFLEELWDGLFRLEFKDNFHSFEVIDLSLTAATEETIVNKLKIIPRHRIITKQSTLAVTKDGDWDKSHVRIESDIDCVVNIIYFA